MGGMAPLMWDGQAAAIRFNISLEGAPFGKVRYQIGLDRLGGTGAFEIGIEELLGFDSNEKSDAPKFILRRPSRAHNSLSEGLMDQMSAPVLPAPSEAMLFAMEGLQHPIVYFLQRSMRDWSIYNDMRVDQEAEIRRAAVTRAEKRVAPDGQNLIAALHTLYEGDRQFEDFVDSAMRSAFPDDYDKLTFPPAEDGRTQLRIRRKRRKRADSASDLSDGTLRFLLLIAILGSPDPAPLIAIDEPETGLHPRMLPIIAEVAANSAMKSQVIFTTHSPNLLDSFGDDLPTTTIVTSNGADTELKTIGGDELTRWVKDYSLGKFAFSGEADAVL